jgi:hypothetical protein
MKIYVLWVGLFLGFFSSAAAMFNGSQLNTALEYCKRHSIGLSNMSDDDMIRYYSLIATDLISNCDPQRKHKEQLITVADWYYAQSFSLLMHIVYDSCFKIPSLPYLIPETFQHNEKQLAYSLISAFLKNKKGLNCWQLDQVVYVYCVSAAMVDLLRNDPAQNISALSSSTSSSSLADDIDFEYLDSMRNNRNYGSFTNGEDGGQCGTPVEGACVEEIVLQGASR